MLGTVPYPTQELFLTFFWFLDVRGSGFLDVRGSGFLDVQGPFLDVRGPFSDVWGSLYLFVFFSDVLGVRAVQVWELPRP